MDQEYVNFLLVLLNQKVFDVGYQFNAFNWWRHDVSALSCRNPENYFVHCAGSKRNKRETLEGILKEVEKSEREQQ